MTNTLVPSLPAHSYKELQELFENMRGVSKGVQVDIVDGRFVPHRSWPFTETDVEQELTKLKSYTDDFQVEIDCMINAPEQFLDQFVRIGIQRVIVHVGSTKVYGQIIAHARTHGYAIGLAFTNDVPLSFVQPFIEKIDFVQIMGIAQVGQQGQPFDERTLTTARALREAYPDLEIAVDGSVNAQTIPLLREAGVNRFAPGSAVCAAPDQAAAYKQLQELVTL